MLTTERLRLEPARNIHVELFVELNSDPEVMRYLLGRAATPAETRTEWAERLGPRTDRRRGLGYWAAYDADGFVGWSSVSSFTDDASKAGLGYRLRRDRWGLGYATEASRAMLMQAFAIPEVERVVASTMAVNTGSRRVMDKLGMTHVDTYVGEWDEPLPGSELGEVVYEIRRH